MFKRVGQCNSKKGIFETLHDKTNKADRSLHWAHMPFCWFCHEVAHLMIIKG